MEAMVYRWERKFANGGVDAQAAGEYMDGLRKNGDLNASSLLEAAKQPESPVHPLFEWNDKKAAHRYRLVQSTKVLRSITVSIERDGEWTEPIRAFVTLGSPDPNDHQEYENITVVMADDNKREILLRKALEELQQWRDRYAELQEFAKLFQFADLLIEKVGEQYGIHA